MTRLLERAIAEVAKLPESEQEAVAAWLLQELASERRWMNAFRESSDVLDQLADEALRELHEGRTEQLDPDGL